MTDVESPAPFCPDCGYDLRGISSSNCPECGWEIDLSAAIRSIPWENRAEIGYLRAFLRTISLTTFHPKRFVRAATTLPDELSARLFGRSVVRFAAIPPIILFLAVSYWLGGNGFVDAAGNLHIADLWQSHPTPPQIRHILGPELLFTFAAGATLRPVLPIALLITFALITAAPRLLVLGQDISPAQKARAKTLLTYTTAPLVWMAFPVVTSAFAVALNNENSNANLKSAFVLCNFLTAVFLLAIFLLCCWSTLRTLYASVPRHSPQLLLVGPLMFVYWCFAVIAGLALFPLIAGYFWLVIDSLR
jgi:hypothetical protein